ncbi:MULTISPECIES: helix-turn-helix domain-containing protein [Streptomyces]|uniref:Helix-turn-helix transcriptional regulator n=1 Tax=Streptomyces eurythermus TaxID=42237 RepID=A0ABW6YY95_9ACTN|nr:MULTISPECIES: LuxR C-terminal-related transcriptional regulator [Streptomyces]QIS69666.1 helix-turn-helix transcriptional regulator [Streptomyces sp. DSM 40868]
MLWVLPLLADEMPDSGWEGVRTAIPPMCEPCADTVISLCPWLRRGYVKLRARRAEEIGVRGTLYRRPGELESSADPATSWKPVPTDLGALVLYDSPDARFILAREAVRELRKCTVIEVFAGVGARVAADDAAAGRAGGTDPRMLTWPARTLAAIRLLVQGTPQYRAAATLNIAQSTMNRDISLICQQLGIDGSKYAPVVNAAIRSRVVHLPPLEPVHLRERLVRILELLAEGYTNCEIAVALDLTERTVRKNVRDILRALDAKNRLHAVVRGWQCGILGRPQPPATAAESVPAGQVRA